MFSWLEVKFIKKLAGQNLSIMTCRVEPRALLSGRKLRSTLRSKTRQMGKNSRVVAVIADGAVPLGDLVAVNTL
jgi:hypothetical protein